MNDKLLSIWPILALDGVGEAIGDARPIFVVSADGRFLHFANAAGARFLGLAPARALDTRVALAPRIAERLTRFAAVSAPGATTRELLRFFDGLRSSLVSVAFRKAAADAILVTVDNARTDPADADPAASLAAIAAEGGLVALFDADGDVVAALGDHAALDGVQDDIADALDAEDGEAVFIRRVAAAGRLHDLALIRLGTGDHPRRLLHVVPTGLDAPADAPQTPAVEAPIAAAPLAAQAEVAATADVVTEATPEEAPIAAYAPLSAEPATDAAAAPVVESPASEPPLAPDAAEPVAETAPATPAPSAIAAAPLAAAIPLPPELPVPESPPTPASVEAVTADLAQAVAVITAPPAPAVTPAPEPAPVEPIEATPEPETVAPAAELPTVEAPEVTTAPAEPTLAEPAPLAAVASIAPAAEPEAAGETAPEPERRFPLARALKFVWQMDAERRFTLVSDELARAVGPRAADVVGRSWNDVAEAFGLDREGRVAAALERRDTWSGRTVLWPVEGEALRLPVDLAALPAFDRGRVFTGYRGFGTIRGDEPVPDPTGAGLRLAATDAPAEAAPVVADLAASSAEPQPDTELPTAIDISEPPSWPDDIETALAEDHRAEITHPELEDGEAAFAGEIDDRPPEADAAPAPHPAPAALAMPDLWLDDELALAMATLPPCGEDVAETPEAPAAAAEVDDATTFAPEPEVNAEATDADVSEGESEIAIAGAPAALLAPTDAFETASAEATLSPVVTLAEHGALEAPAVAPEAPVPSAAEQGSAPDDAETPAPLAVEPAPMAPISPLALAADEIRLAEIGPETTSLDVETSPASLATIADAVSPPIAAALSREERLARAPEALRAAVAEIAERAAALEPRIILPAHDEPADPVAAPLAAIDDTPSAATAPTPPEPIVADPITAAEPIAEPAPVAAAPTTLLADPSSKVVALPPSSRLPADAVRLSPPERVAFRQIAEALGARIEGEDLPPTPAPVALAAPVDAAAGEAPATPLAATSAPAAVVDTRLLDRLPGAVAVVKDDDLVYGNEAFLRLLGYPDLAALEAAGGLDALFAGEHVARRWEPAPDGSRPVPVLGHDGRVIPVDATVSTVPWAGASALMLTLTEVTPAPTAAATAAPAEATPPAPLAAPAPTPAPTAAAAGDFAASSLRARVAELEAIIDTATDGVLVLDGEGTILSANHAAEALFGADRAAIVGRSLADRLAPESRRSAMDYLDGLARNGVASVLNDGREVIGVVEQGGLIPLFMTIGRLAAEPSRKYCAVLRDITQWKKSEEDLTAARRRAEEASVHKSDFLAKISHEIRTPLNAIIGFSEVMMDERFGPVGNDRYKDYLRDIHSSGSHIMSLINDLLDLSKVEAGKMDLRFEAVTLADIVSECVAMMQPQANRERIIIRSSLPVGVPPVVADPRSVRQVVLNLLSNAIKFTPSGGQVIVSTTLEDSGEVVLRVRDTGYGMTDKELQTAMEPFRQLHTTRSRGGGTGLGLPLTKALVEANRAVFRIDSTVGQGTLVTVTFPVTRVLAS